jgi:hypothetical protein
LPEGNSISDEVTAGGGGGTGGVTFGKVTGKSREVIPEAQKVSGHMREGHRKPREVPGKSQETKLVQTKPTKPNIVTP